jgi:hypothetical protein
VPIGLAVEGANTHDMRLVEATLESVPVERPQPRRTARQHLCADKGYDYPSVRQTLREWGYTIHIKSRGEEAERTISRLDIDALIVCSMYGAAEEFRDLEQDNATRNALASVFDVPRIRGAIVRLLHLVMLRTDVQGATYAYHWTYLGREVVAKSRSSQRLQVMT